MKCEKGIDLKQEIILVIQNLPTKKSPKGFTGQFYEIKKYNNFNISQTFRKQRKEIFLTHSMMTVLL